ncbi:hypothetical protein ABW38_26545 [Achromobacter xylosoxidans]|uniref:hypothetical protein n=1 Tax=Alcaligenes xylosoxydans xylosoxydans TaxID=85698 RepID=UPI0006AC470E|nr:hypothetical protein [Achromobacter xylosoxidans]KOQ21815.1 hypothetical protein ABW35_21070 [Achromobacter xylosoxidans]KOQ24179.1 hypothetical protein ABW36_23825 [Achromobacter xylosoxidans]KOQ31007.1 hypothetical protein ABW34_02245 [Achromobacter xylosoxidans]KOQ37916.1 hypothetical protein ABW38_26545 [Achromobacter xylosoxidans]KOQ45220.1 hypothetical protein ABW37_07050 [Achromobacter xylosoxidans]
MTTNHTPGPWSTHLVDSTVVVIPRRPFPQQISTLGHSEVADEQDYANARLIAAAPELLEALEWALRAMEARNPLWAEGERFIAARAAIAKAKGEQQ